MEVLWYAILGKGWGEGVGGFFLLLFLSFVLFYVLCLLVKKKSDILFIFFGILFTINKSLQKKKFYPIHLPSLGPCGLVFSEHKTISEGTTSCQ